MTDYRCHVFDFDGVLVDSAHAKTEAFRRVASRYGEEYGVLMAQYHREAGSIGRRARWEHFFAQILGLEPQPGEVDECVALTTDLVRRSMRTAEMVPGVKDYLYRLTREGAVRYVVSGIEYEELRTLLVDRCLGGLFHRIRGGDKHAILRQMVEEGVIALPAIYYGDQPDDGVAARAADMDFVAVLGCSEFTASDFPPGTTVIEDFRAAVPA